ncbi:MAG: TetR/AcrR family transcriptional regulator [Proteobacteria bacterium]|nr:TetR/AcrR family transcriptional regulator [Pseudomonadota bacterium]
MVKQPAKVRAARRGGGRRQAPRETLAQRIACAALAVAAREGWRRASLSAIAAEAGVGIAGLYHHYRSKPAVLAGFVRMIDQEVLARLDPELAEEPPRDRLFEVLMRRLDALKPYKEGVRAVLADLPADPFGALAALPAFLGSMAWMLEAAHVDASGLAGILRANGLALVWASTVRAWLGDDTADMAPTMAALDRALRRAEAAAGLCQGCRRLFEGTGKGTAAEPSSPA